LPPGIDRPAVVAAEEEKQGVRDGVGELDTGRGPVLHEARAEGEDDHEDGSANEGEPRRRPEQDEEAEEGFRPWQQESEGRDGGMGQRRVHELGFDFGPKDGGTGPQAAHSVDGDVDTEEGAEERVGEAAVVEFLGGGHGDIWIDAAGMGWMRREWVV